MSFHWLHSYRECQWQLHLSHSSGAERGQDLIGSQTSTGGDGHGESLRFYTSPCMVTASGRTIAVDRGDLTGGRPWPISTAAAPSPTATPTSRARQVRNSIDRRVSVPHRETRSLSRAHASRPLRHYRARTLKAHHPIFLYCAPSAL